MKKILAIDDETSNLNAIKRIFYDDDNIDLELLNDGRVAHEKILSFRPDVILLDIVMPGADGYDICKKVKSDKATREIMVLLLSGKAEVEDRLKGYEVKADDYITKPYDEEELKAKVKILLRLKKANDLLLEANTDLEKKVEQRTKELVKKERQAIVGQMVQGIVHNLKGPLTGAIGFIQLADTLLSEYLAELKEKENQTCDSMEQVLRYVKIALKSQENLKSLIQSLLLKGRRDASHLKETLNINEIIAAEFDFMQADMVIKHHISKKFDFTENLPAITGLYSDFSQVFCNLIQNASDAMRDSPKKNIRVATNFDKENIYIEFHDTGPGIDQSLDDKIFEPFFTTKVKESSETNACAGGSGLGLYTCAEILKFYNGQIKIDRSIDSGTCFIISIPYKS